MRNLKVLLVTLPLLMCACQSRGGAASSSERLQALIDEYVAARENRRDDTTDRDMDAASFLDEIDAQRRLLDRLTGISAHGLTRSQDIDRRYLIGLLETDIRLAEVRRPWQNDPAIYVPSRDIASLLERGAVTPDAETCEGLQAHLGRLPGNLAAAGKNLERPPRRFVDEAMYQVDGTLTSIRGDMAPLLRGCDDAGDLGTAADAAVAALEDYLEFLRAEVVPRADGDWAIGEETYDFILRRRWFLDADSEEVLLRGLAAFEETEAEAERVAFKISPGRHWTSVYERLKDDHPEADELKQAYQAQMDAAQRFVVEKRILTLPPGEHVVTVDTPPAMRRSSPFGTFQTVGPFDDGLEGRLVLTPIEEWMTPEQQRERLRSHHRAWIPIIAVHEAYPGHHAQALKRNENNRVLRRLANESIFSEGWGLYTEQIMFEFGFLQGNDVKLTQLRNRLWRAARVILDVSLNTGRMDFDEAVDFLVEKVRFERYAAELEVGMYPRRPTYYLGYLIGMQELQSIHEDWIDAFGQPKPQSEFFDALLTVGALPPALVREELFEGR